MRRSSAAYLGAPEMAIAAFRKVGPEARQKLVYQFEHLGSFDNSERIAKEILADDPYRAGVVKFAALRGKNE